MPERLQSLGVPLPQGRDALMAADGHAASTAVQLAITEAGRLSCIRLVQPLSVHPDTGQPERRSLTRDNPTTNTDASLLGNN
jgi:hypothetical protein